MKKIIVAVVIVILMGLFGFYLWAVVPYYVMDEANEALMGDEYVDVINDTHIYFRPSAKLSKKLENENNIQSLKKGVILYPGTRVDSEAYAPLAKEIAEQGYTVVLAQMPMDLSVLNIKAADEIISEASNIDTWAIAGHSMGGAMAAFYTADHLDAIDGLIFLGSYPSENTDLRESDVDVLSIFGEFDLVASKEEINEKRLNLPDDTTYVEINGGNHEQFGWYGEQKGDGEATITYLEQQEIVVDAILDFMVTLE